MARHHGASPAIPDRRPFVFHLRSKKCVIVHIVAIVFFCPIAFDGKPVIFSVFGSFKNIYILFDVALNIRDLVVLGASTPNM